MKNLLRMIFGGLVLAACACLCVMSFYESREVVYFLIPLGGLLSQIGGTWNKAYRRFALPLMTTVCIVGLLGSVQQIGLTAGITGGLLYWLASMPFTFIGDSLRDHWFNYVWAGILGLLGWQASLPLAIVSSHVVDWLLLGIWPVVVWPLFGILSNVKGSAKFFEWKLDEAFMWMATLVPICTLVSWYGR